MIGLRKDGDRILVSAPYDPKFTARAKELGGKWSREEKAWKLPNDPDVAEAVENLIQEVYGVDIHEPLVWAKIAYAGTDPWEEEGKPVTIGGAELAIARGRDSGARVGENVFLLKGEVDSGGSMKRWKSVVMPGAVFKALVYRGSAIPEGWEIEYLEDEPVNVREDRDLLDFPQLKELPEAELRQRGEKALDHLLLLAREAAGLPGDWDEVARRKLGFVDRVKEVIWIEFLTGADFPAEEKLILRAVMDFVQKHGRLQK